MNDRELLDMAVEYFQKELDLTIEKKLMFPSTKITNVWFSEHDSLFYCAIEHCGEIAYSRIDKHTILDS